MGDDIYEEAIIFDSVFGDDILHFSSRRRNTEFVTRLASFRDGEPKKEELTHTRQFLFYYCNLQTGSDYPSISESLTGRPSARDFPAAIAIRTGCSPSSPFTGTSLSLMTASMKSFSSAMNASL